MILVIDDSEHVHILLEFLLPPAGFSVLSAWSGEEGVAQLQAHSTEVAAVLLDLHMPGMGGVATYHTLRSIDPLLPIIIFTAYDLTEVRPYFPAQETVPVLEKHCDHKQLLATLTDVLTKRRGQ